MAREFENVLEDILKFIKSKPEGYKLEKKVTRRIITPVLDRLDWPTHDEDIVKYEEYTRDGKRVDVSLRHNHNPEVFIEVKKLGLGGTPEAKIQALNYALAGGIPLVVLTDGQKWNFFYLPPDYLLSEGSDCDERCFLELDLLEKSPQESCAILRKYLARDEVVEGWVVDAAEGFFRKKDREKELRKKARREIPDAWTRRIKRKKSDSLLEQLIEQLANDVYDEVRVRPDDDDVVAFLQSLESKNDGENTRQPRPKSERRQTPTLSSVSPGRKAAPTKAAKNYPGILVRGSGDKKIQPGRTRHTLIQAWFTGENAERKLDYENAVHIGIKAGYDRRTVVWQLNRMEKNKLIRFEEQAQGNVREKESEESQRPRAGEIVIFGKKFPFELKSGADAMAIVLQELQKRKSDLYERIYEDDWNWGQKKTRRRIAPSPEELYPYEHNRHLRKKYKEINNNWVVSTNYKREAIEEIIKYVTTEARFKFKEDVIIKFDD